MWGHDSRHFFCAGQVADSVILFDSARVFWVWCLFLVGFYYGRWQVGQPVKCGFYSITVYAK